MDKNDLVKKLKKDIQDIYSISDRFNDISEIHQIDIDLALSKVRNLYDLLLKLNPQENKKPVYVEEIKQEPIKKVIEKDPEPVIIVPEIIEVKEEIIPEPELIIEAPVKEEPIVKIPEKSKEVVSQEPINKPVKEKPERNHNGGSPEIVAEKFHSKKFVNETISNQSSKIDVSSKLQSKPISDINSAIGLNDKFIFIRELFNGDKERYTETIQILNNFDNFDNAVNFISENFDWDTEDPNYERLIELVRRKYS